MDDPSTNRDTAVGPDGEPTTGMPRWVKVSGIVALVVVALVLILLFTGAPGRHGPGRHTGGLAGTPPVASVAAPAVPPR
jgi:hypothetical protein